MMTTRLDPTSFALAAVALCTSFRAAYAQRDAPTQRLIDERKPDSALVLVEAFLRRAPNDGSAMQCIGRVHLTVHKPGDAIDWLEKEVKADAANAAHHYWLGQAVGALAMVSSKLRTPFLARRARAEWERTVELDPAYVDARIALTGFYSVAPGILGGGSGKARAQAREILKLNPMRGHIALATIAESEDKFPAAEQEYLAAIAIAANADSAVHVRLALGRLSVRSVKNDDLGEVQLVSLAGNSAAAGVSQ